MAEEELYEVEKLIAKRKRSKRVEYLVRWKGYSRHSDTWEPVSNLSTCKDLVRAFNSKHLMLRTSSIRGSNSRKTNNPASSFSAGGSATHQRETNSQSSRDVRDDQRTRDEVVTRSMATNSSKNRKGLNQRASNHKTRIQNTCPRMTQPLLKRKSDLNLTMESLQSKHRKSFYRPSRPRGKYDPMTSLPVSARFIVNCRDVEIGKPLPDPYHTQPPSSDHEYFSSPYKGYVGTWREKRGKTPSTSGSDGSRTSNDGCEVIIEKNAVKIPKSWSSSSSYLWSPESEESPVEEFEPFYKALDANSRTLRGLSSRSEHLHLLRRGTCMEIIFSKEDNNNSFNPKILDDLSRILENAATDSCALVLLSSVGDCFCSGFDIDYLHNKLSSNSNLSSTAKRCASSIRNFIRTLIDFPKPLIAMVQGPAIGLGCSILPHFDTVYSSDRAYYLTPYTDLGQTPDGCSSLLFPQIFGHSLANDLLLNGTTLTAIEAKSAGLVSDVYLHDSLKRNVLPILKNLSLKSKEALAATKELIRNPLRAKLKYINQCEYVALKQCWSLRETLTCISQYCDRSQLSYSPLLRKPASQRIEF